MYSLCSFWPFGNVVNGYAQAFMHAAGQMCRQPLARGQEQGAGSKPAKETLLINAIWFYQLKTGP